LFPFCKGLTPPHSCRVSSKRYWLESTTRFPSECNTRARSAFHHDRLLRQWSLGCLQFSCLIPDAIVVPRCPRTCSKRFSKSSLHLLLYEDPHRFVYMCLRIVLWRSSLVDYSTVIRDICRILHSSFVFRAAISMLALYSY
jgi:hypothetical protein